MNEDELRAEFERKPIGFETGCEFERTPSGAYFLWAVEEAWEQFKRGAMWADARARRECVKVAVSVAENYAARGACFGQNTDRAFGAAKAAECIEATTKEPAP